MGVTNTEVAKALLAHGASVVLSDDGDPVGLLAITDEMGATGGDTARIEGRVDVVPAPDAAQIAAMVARVDAVIPTPGLPERHPLFAAARHQGRPILSEFDLAAAWDDRPVLAITGTNGKTTVTTLVDAMLAASGVRSAAVGNTEVPLVAAIEDPDTQVFVVEASSFRLAHSRRFRPRVATWLNFAEDHLDVHSSLERYRSAKARIFADQDSTCVAVVNADDPVVLAARPSGPDAPRVVRFGLTPSTGGVANDYFERDGVLFGPDDVELARCGDLWSSLPHDRSNVLAAAATALAGGADLHGVRSALVDFSGLSHRVQRVGERSGIAWYDDSKATAPHATIAAVRGFDSVVLIAGGRNKGLDLSALAEVADRVRAVVGIGEAAPMVIEAFPGVQSASAASMEDAVAAAARFATPGDAVLLSPGCASFDWYGSYAERGEHFAGLVRALLADPEAT